MTYFVNLDEPHLHLIKVEMAVDDISDKEVIVTMPAWTPGSYLIRDFGKNIRNFRATTASGDALDARKKDKSSWRIPTAGNTSIRCSYEVFCDELSPRTSHMDASHAFILGTSVFMYLEGYKDQALELVVRSPEGWKISTSLEKVFENRYKAINYDVLVDSPLEIGTHFSASFQADGKEHEVAIFGMDGVDLSSQVADIKKIVETALEIFEHAPYRHYLFIIHAYPGFQMGGLEHSSSNVISVDRSILLHGERYDKFLSVVAHEYFHLWNVKRIKPVELGPFNYREENYTTLLWFFEGVTDFFADIIVLRSGLIDEKKFLAEFAELAKILELTPGARDTTLADSSFDTWIRLYKPSPDDLNSYVSYYLKGKFIGLMIASRIVQHSGGYKTIDDLLRALFDKFRKDGKGIVDRDIIASLKDITGSDYTEFFSKYIHGREKIDFDSEFKSMGLVLKRTYSSGKEDGGSWLGMLLKKDGAVFSVAGVFKNKPAYAAGINTGDELIAINSIRFSDLNTRVMVPIARAIIDHVPETGPGQEVLVTFFRRGVLKHISVLTASAPYDNYELVEDKDQDLGKKVRQKILRGQIT